MGAQKLNALPKDTQLLTDRARTRTHCWAPASAPARRTQVLGAGGCGLKRPARPDPMHGHASPVPRGRGPPLVSIPESHMVSLVSFPNHPRTVPDGNVSSETAVTGPRSHRQSLESPAGGTLGTRWSMGLGVSSDPPPRPRRWPRGRQPSRGTAAAEKSSSHRPSPRHPCPNPVDSLNASPRASRPDGAVLVRTQQAVPIKELYSLDTTMLAGAARVCVAEGTGLGGSASGPAAPRESLFSERLLFICTR